VSNARVIIIGHPALHPLAVIVTDYQEGLLQYQNADACVIDA